MKFKVYPIVLLLFLTGFSHAQVEFRIKKLNPDSLTELLSEKEGTELAEVLNLLSNVLCEENTEYSLELAKEAISLSQKLEYNKGMADGYFNLGNDYFLLDSLKPTITNYLKALRIYETTEPSEEFGNLCMQLSIINYFAGRIDVSLEYVRQARDIYFKIDDKPGKFSASLSMGLCKKDLGEIDSAFFYYHKALSFLDLKRDHDNAAYAYNAIGLNVARQSDASDTSFFRKTLSWLFKALELPNTGCNIRATVCLNIAYQYLLNGSEVSKSTGMEYLQKANDIADSCFDAYANKSTIYSLLGWESYNSGDINKAISQFKQALEIAEKRLSTFSITEYTELVHAYNDRYYLKLDKQRIYGQLYDIYIELGNYKTAHEYYVLSKKAEEEIFLEVNSNLITMLESESEDEKIEKQITLLARDNQLKEMKIKQSWLIIFGLGGVFVILILIGLLFLRQNKLKNDHKTVILEQKLLKLQMNPHFIYNALSNIMSFIEDKKTDNAIKYLSSFSRLLRTTLESTRKDNILLEQEVITLKSYLELQQVRYEGKFEYSINVDKQLDPEDIMIPPMLLQPFVENAIEHGVKYKNTKGHIDIRFFLEENKLICEIEDDGVGRERAWETEYKTQKEHKSMATAIITDRIQAINKKVKQKIWLDIIDLKSDNNEAVGTKVVLGVPIVDG